MRSNGFRHALVGAVLGLVAACGATEPLADTGASLAESRRAFELDTTPSFPTGGDVAAIAVGEPPYGVAAADLDGDGSVDLVGYRLTREGTLVHVFRNAGQRTFVPTHALQIDGSAMGLVVRDLNGDGIPDLATGTSFLIGNGDGTFQAPRSFSLEANAFALIDLDLDGLPDVVLTHIQSPFLRVEMNTSR